MIYRGCDYWSEKGPPVGWFWKAPGEKEGRGPHATEGDVLNQIDRWKKAQLQPRSESGMEGSSI